MGPTVGVVISGCGYLDGAEIQETVCTLLALDRAGATVKCYAPDVEVEAVDHLAGEATGQRRNALEEAARIVRGQVEALDMARASDLDALVLPGGFGAAKVLSDFAFKGHECEVDPDLAQLVRDVHAAKKPIGAICIAPAVIARALGELNPSLTIGNDSGTAKTLERMGAKHSDCPTTEFVVDKKNKIVSTPAYMLGPGVKDVQEGIQKTVDAVLSMI